MPSPVPSDPQQLAGRNILITGASTGIGRATAIALARRGATLYLAGRSEERHQDVLAMCQSAGASVTYLPLELDSLVSVRACAERFLALDVPLHVLIANAGLAGSRGLTREGFELTFGVNHLGHFLLTELLLERLKRTAPSRIVIVASSTHYQAKGIDWAALRAPTRSLTGMPEYRVSKLCNVLHAKELATRLAGSGVSTYAVHPGAVASDIWRNVPGSRYVLPLIMKSNEQGATTSIHCAAAEAAGAETGLYYHDSKPRTASALANDTALALELCARSREWTGLA
jgi:NAD(P)-dependent dehydrogenase (short-subunit alcohol dehydrogenase family)